MNAELTCKQRVSSHLKDRMDDLTKLWKLYNEGDEASDEELGRFEEYGLCFDYVAPGTFNGQRKGYFRYQLSYGGPSDEFRFFVNPDFSCYRIEYWFLDWFDGAKRILTGKREALMLEIYENFRDCGSCQAEYERATE